MELFYNPDQLPEDEIKATFVAQQPLVDELVNLVKSQKDGAGVQHCVIIAPRGMGKTTVLLMVRFAIQDRGLDRQWQVIKFPEESYGIYDLADFWLEVLGLLVVETGDNELRQRTEELKRKYPNNDELQEVALAMLKDWRRKHKRRLLLLVENFDLILAQINDERDNARLRDVLMNDGTIMLIGSAVSFFEEARAYDQPLYNFFKIYNLAYLNFEQTNELLRQRAVLDNRQNFEQTLAFNAGRLRALAHFTGGNPRMILMLYRVLAHSDITDIQHALEKLLDEVTPYYKAKVESLPPQQRKILDYIARESSRTSEGVTPGTIAEATRLTPNQTSVQLKRLVDLGYMRAANVRERNSYYTLSEPLYAIWHQMRFGRDGKERMLWLVDWLKVLFTTRDIMNQAKLLNDLFRRHLSEEKKREANNILEQYKLLAESCQDTTIRLDLMNNLLYNYLDLGEAEKVNDLLKDSIRLEELTNVNLFRLYEDGIISEQKWGGVSARRTAAGKASSLATLWVSEPEEKLYLLNQAFEIDPQKYGLGFQRGVLLYHLGRYEEAVESFEQAIRSRPAEGPIIRFSPGGMDALFELAVTYLCKFAALMRLGRLDAARETWEKAWEMGRQANDAQFYRIAYEKVIDVAESEGYRFIRDLITETYPENSHPPLARALDYLLTGDDALIEKLSPEVRGIVEEIIQRLKSAIEKSDSSKPKPKPRKSAASAKPRFK
jgi:tetratricopeptide (TPR) repeat protein